MREIPRRKIVATSLCAGPGRVAWADSRTGAMARSGSCLCGDPRRHCAQFLGMGDACRMPTA